MFDENEERDRTSDFKVSKHGVEHYHATKMTVISFTVLRLVVNQWLP